MQEQLPEIVEKFGKPEEIHPAYGVAQVSRYQSTGMNLFGSDLTHHNYITITVSKASVGRDLHNDYVHPGEELIEFSMSHAQWARFVAGSDMSFATEVTLGRYSEGGTYSLIPRIAQKEETRKDQFDREFQQKLQKSLKDIQDSVESLQKLSNDKSVSKAKLKQIAFDLLNQIGNLPRNLDFAVEQFKEVTEKGVQDAKIEIEAYISEAMRQGSLPSVSNQESPALPPDSTNS